ncbi:hypothetical protein F5883DRAFT_570588, partial [Diaporthe sp. PMI_573]
MFEMLLGLLPCFRSPRATALPSCSHAESATPARRHCRRLFGERAPQHRPDTPASWKACTTAQESRTRDHVFFCGKVLSTSIVSPGSRQCDIGVH